MPYCRATATTATTMTAAAASGPIDRRVRVGPGSARRASRTRSPSASVGSAGSNRRWRRAPRRASNSRSSIGGLQAASDRAKRVVEARLHGPQRDVQPFGNILQPQVLPEAQEHDDPVVGVEVVDGAVELRVGGAHIHRVAPLRLALERDGPNPLALPHAEAIPTAVDEDAVEPGVEAGVVAQRAALAPGGEARVLDGVLSLLVGEQDRPGDPVGGTEVAFDQADEHVRLSAGRDGLHEVSRVAAQLGPRRVTPSDDWGVPVSYTHLTLPTI